MQPSRNDVRKEEQMKVETWNGYKIRFVLKDGEWWAVANDVCDALAIKNPRDAIKKLKE